MLQGDRGTVVVGGGVELGDIASHNGMDEGDVLDEELAFEENERKHARSQGMLLWHQSAHKPTGIAQPLTLAWRCSCRWAA